MGLTRDLAGVKAFWELGGWEPGCRQALGPLTTGRWGIEPLPSILSLFVALGCAESGHTPGRLS